MAPLDRLARHGRWDTMNGYGFFSSLRMFFILGLFVFAGIFVAGQTIYSELSTEARFRRTYGANWRTEYDQVFGSLAKARAKTYASAVGIVVISALVVRLRRVLRPVDHSRHPSGRKKRPHRDRYGSQIERASLYRRNAVLGIYFGLAGIVGGVILVIFRAGVFADHSNEVVLGMFVFLAGYIGVIAGCAYWLKAKGWSEAIVFIGLMPLVIPMIPFVRLILLAAPAILPCAMVMMPLTLIVVVATLPDKSGRTKRRARWDLTQFGSHRDESLDVKHDADRSNKDER